MKAYDGSGDWFKIYHEGICNKNADISTINSNAWCSNGKSQLAAKIPKNTPNGEYLARFEHIGQSTPFPPFSSIPFFLGHN